jgi:hypothetical protein
MNKLRNESGTAGLEVDRKILEVEWHVADAIFIAVVHRRAEGNACFLIGSSNQQTEKVECVC